MIIFVIIKFFQVLLQQIIIIENNSREEEKKKLKKIKDDKVNIIYMEDNRGYSAAINAGCKYLIDKYGKCNIVVSNADIVINSEKYVNDETNKIWLKRFATPEEIAKVIAFLASDEANYIQGEIIKIDGGYQDVQENIIIYVDIIIFLLRGKVIWKMID